MSREALEVGAFTWGRIQRLHDKDPAVHWQRCEAEGLECPQETFAQLFHEDANDADFAAIVRAVDWGRVRWELEEFSGRRFGRFASIADTNLRSMKRAIGRGNLASSMIARTWSRIGAMRSRGSRRR